MSQPSLSEINPVTKTEIGEEQKALLIVQEDYDVSQIRKELLDPSLDAFVLHNLLTPQECDELIKNTEEIDQYSFWNASSPKTDFRDVNTIGKKKSCSNNFLQNALTLWWPKGCGTEWRPMLCLVLRLMTITDILSLNSRVIIDFECLLISQVNGWLRALTHVCYLAGTLQEDILLRTLMAVR